MDLWGRALWDYHRGFRADPLYLQTSYGPLEQVPLSEFFRYDLKFPQLDAYALNLCRGDVLDIGAGTGSHALITQKKGLKVTALEVSEGACKVMKDRGVLSVVHDDLHKYVGGPFDTLLLLMNGVGLAGKKARLKGFLQGLKKWLAIDGQIVMDSCDVRYLFDSIDAPAGDYYGDLRYSYQYKGQIGQPFPWLFADPFTLIETAATVGLDTQIVYQEGYQYLARLQLV